MQNKGHLKWIKNYLGNQSIPIYSFIVFSERCTLKDINLTSNEHFVIKRDVILPAVHKTAEKAGKQLTASDIDILYEKLYPLTQLSEDQKRQHIENIQKNHSAEDRVSRKPTMLNLEPEMPNQKSAKLEQNAVPSEQKSVMPEHTATPINQTPAPSINLNLSEQPDVFSERSSDGETGGVKDNGDIAERICPRCGNKLVLRTSSRGVYRGKQFWGCSDYPKCRYIGNVEQNGEPKYGQQL